MCANMLGFWGNTIFDVRWQPFDFVCGNVPKSFKSNMRLTVLSFVSDYSKQCMEGLGQDFDIF